MEDKDNNIVSISEPENHVLSSDEIMKNRMRLRTSIAIVLYLTFRDYDFYGDGEFSQEKFQDVFDSLVNLGASVDVEFAQAVLEDDTSLSMFSSYQFRKEILQIVSRKVKNHIREEIGDSKFSIVVGGDYDQSQREQIALILRFVDKKGFIQERLFDIVHVEDNNKFRALHFKEELCAILSQHNLDVSNIRGQGYDGSCLMREQWNGLQALFLNECPYAYHIHCFAHKLQLALVCASQEVIPIYHFFSKLTRIVNFFCSCSKPNDDLLAAQLDKIAHLLEIEELGTRNGENQNSTLQRVGDTRSRSHFSSICNLINMYDETCTLLEKLTESGSTYCQRGDANIAYENMTTFEFLLIVHLMRNIMRITDSLCQALQQQRPNVVNVKHIVRSTKALLQNMKQDGWEKLLKNVISFCEKNDIKVPQLNAPYKCDYLRQENVDGITITIEHYYRTEVFLFVIDKQIQELNSRFRDQALELLTLSSALVPKDTYKAFNIDHICTLVEKYYPKDFNEQEKINLKCQLQHFIIDARQDSNLKNLSTIQELCTCLAETKKSEVYCLIDRLLRLIMTLPVSAATTERSSSAMKTFKTMLKNMMEDEFLADGMLVYIERDIAQGFPCGSIAADFESLKERDDSQPCSSVNDCLVGPSELLGEEESDGSSLLEVAEDMAEDDISSSPHEL
ncbi:zinc finger MYM-type protein 1-like isoform X2 [Trifolium pratense]|uniref:zinc finger MYM-type protein 1-like isoform X2 n=1 Tax=Trifolium pratense TaxID=57577 RepID=UPI001E696C1B|nr:zinc finger MYM-type protein 1-like isoform X2 [Trifolium pratense]